MSGRVIESEDVEALAQALHAVNVEATKAPAWDRLEEAARDHMRRAARTQLRALKAEGWQLERQWQRGKVPFP